MMYNKTICSRLERKRAKQNLLTPLPNFFFYKNPNKLTKQNNIKSNPLTF